MTFAPTPMEGEPSRRRSATQTWSSGDVRPRPRFASHDLCSEPQEVESDDELDCEPTKTAARSPQLSPRTLLACRPFRDLAHVPFASFRDEYTHKTKVPPASPKPAAGSGAAAIRACRPSLSIQIPPRGGGQAGMEAPPRAGIEPITEPQTAPVDYYRRLQSRPAELPSRASMDGTCETSASGRQRRRTSLTLDVNAKPT